MAMTAGSAEGLTDGLGSPAGKEPCSTGSQLSTTVPAFAGYHTPSLAVPSQVSSSINREMGGGWMLYGMQHPSFSLSILIFWAPSLILFVIPPRNSAGL